MNVSNLQRGRGVTERGGTVLNLWERKAFPEIMIFQTKNSEYRCILNYYPINSKTISWGNFKITLLKTKFDEIFRRQFLPQKLPAVASLHIMLQN